VADDNHIIAGGARADGAITLRARDGRDRIRLDGRGGNMWVGGNGADGDIVIFSRRGDNRSTADATIHLDGDAGDIVLQNADAAEDFPVAELADVEPGCVVVLGESGQIRPCDKAYDRRVAGVISGAGTLRPGMVLGRRADGVRRAPLALLGTVYCWVDADHGPIAVGDLLTTSPTAGHAMKASDPVAAFGCVLGKALDGCRAGVGLIRILVSLQ